MADSEVKLEAHASSEVKLEATSEHKCEHTLLRRRAGGICPVCSALSRGWQPPPITLPSGKLYPDPHELLPNGKYRAEDSRKPGRPRTRANIAMRGTSLDTTTIPTPTSDLTPSYGNLKGLAKLPRAQLVAIMEQGKSLQARRSFYKFFTYGWHVLEPATALADNWHIKVVCEHLQQTFEDWLKHKHDPTYEQRVRSLLINIPPGTAKSRIVSVYFPAWVWLHHPEWRVICLSANPGVALRDSMYARELIASEWYQRWFKPSEERTVDGITQAGWSIKQGQDAKGKFENTRGGFRVAKGFDAQIVGDRADCLLFDDPHDAADVYSDVQRKSVLERWDQAVRNRVNDPSSSLRIGVMQRLHENDLAGHVLLQGGWEHLCLPMEYEEPRQCKCDTCVRGETAFGWKDPRKPGECLHPARFTAKVLKEEKKALGSMGYAAQMQQAPSPAEGGFFKRVHWRWATLALEAGTSQRPNGCNEMPALPIPRKKFASEEYDFDWIILSVDCSSKGVLTGSRTGLLVIAGKGSRKYVLDDYTDVLDPSATVKKIREIKAKYPNLTAILIEDKAAGPAVVSMLKDEISGMVEINPEGGKEVRAMAVQPTIEAGDVYLIDGATWIEPFVHEMSMFPNGTHDDRVDALSQALTWVAEKLHTLGLWM